MGFIIYQLQQEKGSRMKRNAFVAILGSAAPIVMLGCSLTGTKIGLPADIKQPVVMSSVVGTGQTKLPADAKKLDVVTGTSLESISQSSSGNTTTTTMRHKNDVAANIYNTLGSDQDRCITNVTIKAKTIYTIAGVKTEMKFNGTAFMLPAKTPAPAAVPANPDSSKN